MEAWREMSESTDRESEMIHYLLGTLPEAEMERFDFLSVTDSDFADELSVTEENLVDAYVKGELTGVTLARFEAHYLASPLRWEKVEFARAFQTFTERQVMGTRTARVSFQPRAWQQVSILRWSLVAAASLILLAAGGWWTMRDRPGRAEEQLVATFILTPPLRASDRVPAVSIPSDRAAIEIQLELASDEYETYRVALTDESGEAKIWMSDQMQATRDGKTPRLGVRLPAQLLQARIYLLVVSGIAPDGREEVTSAYPFQVEMP